MIKIEMLTCTLYSPKRHNYHIPDLGTKLHQMPDLRSIIFTITFPDSSSNSKKKILHLKFRVNLISVLVYQFVKHKRKNYPKSFNSE